MSQRIIRVYELTPERVHLDATTISGYHEGSEKSLSQYGYSKDDPTLKQVKAMVAALDPPRNAIVQRGGRRKRRR